MSVIRRLIRAFYDRCFRQLVAEQVRVAALCEPRIFGDPSRVRIAKTAKIWNAYINVASGNVSVGEYAFFGNSVSLVTGTHNYTRTDLDRQEAFPVEGGDIIIAQGAWIGTNAIIIGPCMIGEHSVVAAGAVVTHDIEPYTIVAGVPARVIRQITPAGIKVGT